jgi:excisionase family DNA binding protein
LLNRLLNAVEIAEYLGVAKTTIYQWTHEGYIPHIKFRGKFVRFRLSTIDKWLESQSIAGRKERKITVY